MGVSGDFDAYRVDEQLAGVAQTGVRYCAWQTGKAGRTSTLLNGDDFGDRQTSVRRRALSSIAGLQEGEMQWRSSTWVRETGCPP